MSDINIPFPGLYNSILSSEIDSETEQLGESLQENEYPNIELEDVHTAVFDSMNWAVVHEHVARCYTEAFVEWLEFEHGLSIELKFVEMTSPREYNFTTDRIFCSISDEDRQKLFDAVDKDALTRSAKKRFTSYDGFISFYSPVWQTWGELEDWDANQLGTLLHALLTEPIEYWIYYSMLDENDFFHAVDKGLDYKQLEAKLTELTLIASGEIEPDSREFPTATDPSKYVEQFIELNHLTK